MKVKVKVDLMANPSDHVRMNIEDVKIGAIRTVKVNIQYNYLPKLVKNVNCKLIMCMNAESYIQNWLLKRLMPTRKNI